jgi:AcrR family transcriptional regulator
MIYFEHEEKPIDEISGTKEHIFYAFLDMTSNLGYENVSIRDITKKVGIKPASMYNHFENKGKLLEYAYDYYSRHQYDNRRPVDVMKTFIETAEAKEIIEAFRYTFQTESRKKYVRMILITKIIYMRLFQDPVANAMFAESNANNTEYVVTTLQHGINVGRIESGFDLATFADVLIGSMTIMGIKAFANPSYTVGQLKQEEDILSLLTRLLATALK